LFKEFGARILATLLSQLPDDSSSTIIAVKSDNNTATVNGQKSIGDGPIYDPAFVYILELCTVLSLKDKNSIQRSGAEVSEALQNVIRDSANYHPTLIARAVFYLLSLLHASYVSISRSCLLLG
jgi:brefeldin A-resistance guanine nucleotide exchange factor 1